MAGQIITTLDLINQVRSLLDETNRESVSDEFDILPALNRGQNHAGNILARHYESPMLTYVNYNLTNGQHEYRIPEDSFEQRVEQIEIYKGQHYYPVQRVDYRRISQYQSQSLVSMPSQYVCYQDKIRFLPNIGSDNLIARIWYMQEPPVLVIPQGRITVVNAAQNYVILDEAGADLSTETDQFASYVNIIDSHSGIRKASFQIQSINNNIVTFKSVPTRTTVLNTDIDTDMTDLIINQGSEIADLAIEPDDYVCLIFGSCIPFFKNPFSNYLIQYAVAEITRKLGGDVNAEKQVLKDLEKVVERSWVGRESHKTVFKKSNHYTRPFRKTWWT